MSSTRNFNSILLVMLALLLGVGSISAQRPLPQPEQPVRYANEWAVQLSADANPDAVAAQLGFVNLGAVPASANVYRFVRTAERIESLRGDLTIALVAQPDILQATQQVLLYRELRAVQDTITDPAFPNQWHLNNTGQFGGLAGVDVNIFGAWNYSPACCDGTGVVVSSVDDGVRFANPDIAPNYRADLSYDFLDNDTDPSGGGHGTSVAGVMAAADDGTQCGVGAAFNAQISGIRLVGFGMTPAMEASAFGFQNQAIHIYNNSWGPSDDGRTLEGPDTLATAALDASRNSGRGGLGNIIVWAGGNGSSYDNVNADGYANRRDVIAVGATTNQGATAWYSEPGAPILVNTPSGGGTAGIYTTGYNASGCNTSFGGTSSASPLAAGVVALMLDANPSLTWRDVQHILVQTAERNDPSHASWFQNAAGRWTSVYYGYGRVDAGAAVALASTWTNVPAEQSFSSGVQAVNQAIPDNNAGVVDVPFNVTSLLSVETVEVTLNITHQYRADVDIELISPSGTVSKLMFGRTGDYITTGYANWRMSSKQFWDEPSFGTWTLRVTDNRSDKVGSLIDAALTVYGTSTILGLTSQPASQTILTGDTAALSVGVGGAIGTVHYAWYAGAIGDTSTPVGTDSATFTSDPLASDALFWVRISDDDGYLDSAQAIITVVAEVPLLRDAQFDENASGAWVFMNGDADDSAFCMTNPARWPDPDGCGVRFIGRIGQSAALKQALIFADTSAAFRSGHILSLTGLWRGTDAASSKIRVIVKYGSHPQQVFKITLPTATGGYVPIDEVITPAYEDILKIRVRIVDRSVAGKQRLMALQLTHQPGSTTRMNLPSADGTLPLPAPNQADGFRGNN